MRFGDAIKTCFKKYVTFSGRASRPEYWYFMLFLVLASLVLGLLDSVIFGLGDATYQGHVGPEGAAAAAQYSDGPLSSIFNLLTLIPALAVGWRRMHDTGRSGLYLFYPLIVMVGLSMAAVFLVGLDGFFTGGPDALFPQIGALLSGLTGAGILIGIFVFFISPLLVLWWLTRPTQPGPNPWGPAPA